MPDGARCRICLDAAARLHTVGLIAALLVFVLSGSRRSRWEPVAWQMRQAAGGAPAEYSARGVDQGFNGRDERDDGRSCAGTA